MSVSFQSGTLATPSSTVQVATDQILGVDYQVNKIAFGSAGSATQVSAGSPLPVTSSISSSTTVIGAVLPSSQWTVSVTPSTQFSVTTTPSSQMTVSVSSSTAVFGSVMPSSQWTVTTTPSSQQTISISSSTAVIGAVMPSTQWTVSVTPSTQFTVTTTPSSQITVANSSSTGVIGAVMPSTQWTVTTTPSSVAQIEISSVTASAFHGDDTTTIYSGATAIAPLFAAITTTSSGATQVCSAVSAKSIRVIAMQLTAGSSVNITWASSASTAGAKTGVQPVAANGGYVLPYNPVGWFQSNSGEQLSIILSGPSQIGGSLTFLTI